MKERPILFSTEMVRAILDGRKTQTRRVIHPDLIQQWWDEPVLEDSEKLKYCPYGQVGSKLWVRETFYVQPDLYSPKVPSPIHYKADAGLESYEDYILKPSIFMPRWASRITLEITDIRVQRVQSISGEDAVAEGVNTALSGGDLPILYYSQLWDSINSKRGYGWDKNPYCWVISFKGV